MPDAAVRAPCGRAKRVPMRADHPGFGRHLSRFAFAERNSLRTARIAAPIAQQPAPELLPVLAGLDAQAFLRASKTLRMQSPAESSEIASPRTTDPNLRARLAEMIHELREQLGVPALVKHVAADDDVEATDVGRRRVPRQSNEVDRRNAVKRCIEFEE